MKTVINALSPLEIETEALVLLQPQGAPPADLDQASGGLLTEMAASEEFTGRMLETALLTRPAGVKARRVLLVGLGKDAPTKLDLWRAAGLAARQLKSKGVHRMAVATPAGVQSGLAAGAILTGVASANFEPDTYKSDRKPERRIDELTLLAPNSEVPAVQRAVREAEIIAEAQRFARELENEPGNRMTPTMMGERARTMAEAAGLEFDLIDAGRARTMKMGAFLSVAQGSAEPPVMILLRYNGNPGSKQLLGLIGKGVTFDSGGISIKPAANMEMMKFDMCGGAATLGAMQAIAALKPKINVLAIVPAVENMPGGRAQKPGDVQIAMSGKSIEVLNTDAEGRLILADALCYARQLGATHLVDSATLTGAVVVALGNVYTGVFTNDEAFYSRFETAVKRSGEKMWRLPIDQEYADQIKGTVGDILNTGGRWGGAITAAQFLKEFVAETPWIHLDIAGTAWVEENKAWMPKGPTGTPTYTLIELTRVMAGE